MPTDTATGHSLPRPHWFRVIAVGRNPETTLVRVAILIIVSIIVFHFILLPIRVDGISMQPTYKSGAVDFVDRLAYVWHEPRRGDVVSVRFAGYHLMLMKRIIGLPGETVAFNKGRVLINGQPLDEPYEKRPCNWTLPAKTLDPDEYFIVGDNRTMRWQDHMFGVVERYRIVGKVLF
jgi:signal peptidase I